MVERNIHTRRPKEKVLWSCMPVFLGLLLLASFGFGARNQADENGPAARLNQAPASAKDLKSPLSPQEESDAISAGGQLFQKNCKQCHGSDGHGHGRAADLSAPLIQNAPSGVLFWAIQNGNPAKGMPPWSKLSEKQIWQIIAYVKTLK